jgi:hypothetical protein
MLQQAFEIDVQGPGEQQERQHAVHERLVEIDVADEPRHDVMQVERGHEQVGGDDRQRAEERHCERAAGSRQAQHLVVEVAAGGGDRDQYSGGIESIHGVPAW